MEGRYFYLQFDKTDTRATLTHWSHCLFGFSLHLTTAIKTLLTPCNAPICFNYDCIHCKHAYINDDRVWQMTTSDLCCRRDTAVGRITFVVVLIHWRIGAVVCSQWQCLGLWCSRGNCDGDDDNDRCWRGNTENAHALWFVLYGVEPTQLTVWLCWEQHSAKSGDEQTGELMLQMQKHTMLILMSSLSRKCSITKLSDMTLKNNSLVSWFCNSALYHYFKDILMKI